MGPNVSGGGGGTEYFIFSAEIFSLGGPNILSGGTKLGGGDQIFYDRCPPVVYDAMGRNGRHSCQTLSSGLREASYCPQNGLSSNLIAKIFWGNMPPDPPRV